MKKRLALCESRERERERVPSASTSSQREREREREIKTLTPALQLSRQLLGARAFSSPMEDLRSSRRPAKSSDGDVFGGPPKYPAPFAAKSDDYAEIFGGFCGSCSIPFLDLPPAAETYDGGERIDYSEIFGGFNGGDFAVDYEELFSEKRKAAGSSASSNGRVRMDAKFGQHAEVSDLLPEGDSKNYGASSEKNKFLSSSNQSDDGSKQFNMLCHRTSRGSIEDVISGKAHITELHAVPGYTYMINSCSSQDVRSNNSPNIQTNDLTNNVSYDGQLNDSKQEKAASSTSSTDKTKSSGADLRTNLKEYSARHAASDDDPLNVKHHSRSSSNYSASSGDIPYPDSTYISISDINLRTRPSRVPPPSRAPPKLATKQENNKSRQIHYSIGASRSHGLQEVAKDSSSHFLDVEVDASSAAKASAAAMKEAMEQAEARLKSAKELLERKRDIRKKLAHKEGAKYDESKEVKDSDAVKDFSELTARKLWPKGSKGMKEYALNDTNKGTKVGKVSPNHGEQERYVVTAEESHQMRQGNGFKSSQMCYKSEEVSGQWKTVDQFYELINNEKKSRAVKEASQQEDVEKKTKTTTKVNEEKEIYSEKDELANEFKRTVKLHKVNETIERDDIDGSPKVCNMTSKQEFRKIPDEILETCKLNEPEASSSSYHRNANKKMQAAQEALISGEELKKPDAVEEASCEENEMNLESSNNSFRFEEIYHDDEVNRKLQPAKEACEHGEEEEELSGTYVTSACEENMKMFRRTAVQNENENEMEVTSGTLVREAEEERVACEEAYLYENSDYTSGNGKLESCNAENECKLEGTISVSKHVEIEKSNEVQGPCIPAENDLQTEANQDGNEVKENAVEVKPALGTMGLGVSEKRMSSAKETSWLDYGVETREAQPELQQNEKKQNADQTPSVVENIIDPGVLGGDHTERANGKFKEGNGVLGSEEAHPHCDAAQEDFQRVADKDIGDVQQGSSAQNEDLGDAAEEVFRKSRSSSHDATETPGTVVSENSESGAHKREKMDSEKTIERETCHEKEQARILEEEKEREREREKDRLAVERATRERAIAEARERAERIAVERVTAEARQRALAEAREKAEKASAEALEKALVEKALKEAKLRAERAAVERATAEARERAVEKALAERAAADARQRAERLNTMSRNKNRKENEAGDSFRASDKEDREIKLKPSSSDVLQDIRFKSTGSSSSSQRDSSAHGEVESPLRCKARLERHQRTVERAAKALAEKNLRDILAQREQTERNRLAEALDADVKRWSTGKEGNLRALLSTLQYILGPESGWQPIPLTDVITAAAVKKAYRKATLCVHPDKLQQRGASIQQKYICEKVFDLLKDAWNRFNSEER